MKLKDRRILIAMTGGIACYKACGLLSLLKKSDASVKVIMTDKAKEFITPLTVKTMAGGLCYDDAFCYEGAEPLHISLAKWAEIILIAPASANTIAKIACGLCDNLLTETVLAAICPVIISPAMNSNMLNNPATIENLEKLVERGYEIIKSSEGMLACGDFGYGKLPEPSELCKVLQYALSHKDLKDKKFLITAGAAAEDLDPVRFITNRSSGKMGFALAERAAARGAEVILLSGVTNIDPPLGVRSFSFRSTRDLLKLMQEHFDWADCVIQSAAPADFRPIEEAKEKIKKEDTEGYTLSLIKNPDVAAFVGAKKTHQILVGFAAETENIKSNAIKKIRKKNLDFIVANDVSRKDIGFGSENNAVSIFYKNGEEEELSLMSKSEIADELLDRIICLF